MPLGLTTAPSAADARIHKKILGLDKHKQNNNATTLTISNDEMKDIIKIVKYLENSGLLLEGVRETIQNEAKEQKGGYLSLFLGTLGTSLLGNILAGKRATATSHGRGINRAGEGIVRAAYGNKKGQKNNQMNF